MDGLYLTWNFNFYCKQQLLLFLQSFHIYILHTLTILEYTLSYCKRESVEVGSNVGHWCVITYFCESMFRTGWYWQVFLECCSGMITIKTLGFLWWCTVLKNRCHSEKSSCCRHPSAMWSCCTTISFLGLHIMMTYQCLYCRNSHLQASLL
jgi:hypothetical protein